MNSANFTDNEAPAGLINGVNVTYTLSKAPSPASSLELFRNGVLQVSPTDYTLAGLTITMAAAPIALDVLAAWYRNA